MWHVFARVSSANPGYPVTLPFAVDRRMTAYVLERRWLFPGVQFEHIYQRSYPSLREFGPINPNLIGFVGAITAENIHDRSYGEKLPTIGTAGQGGVEKTYDRYLRGQDGQIQETVDPSGAPVGAAYLTQSPVAGDNVRLTIDARLQRSAQQAIVQGLGIAHSDGQPADYGAVVAMNPSNGAIYAMASGPDVQPDGARAALQGLGGRVQPEEPAPPGLRQGVPGDVPGRIDVQAHHGDGGLRVGRPRAGTEAATARGSTSRGTTSPSRRPCSTTGRRSRWDRWTSRRRSRCPATRSSTSSAMSSGASTISSRAGSASSAMARPRRSTRAARRRASCPTTCGRPSRTGPARRRSSRSSRAGSPATTSTCRSARATCSSPRCSRPSPSAPSRTAATSSARTSARPSSSPAARARWSRAARSTRGRCAGSTSRRR